jgi:hypothetical protein
VTPYINASVSGDMLGYNFLPVLLKCTLTSRNHTVDWQTFLGTQYKPRVLRLEGNEESPPMLECEGHGLEEETELVLMPCGELMAYECVLEFLMNWRGQCLECGMHWLQLDE